MHMRGKQHARGGKCMQEGEAREWKKVHKHVQGPK